MNTAGLWKLPSVLVRSISLWRPFPLSLFIFALSISFNETSELMFESESQGHQRRAIHCVFCAVTTERNPPSVVRPVNDTPFTICADVYCILREKSLCGTGFNSHNLAEGASTFRIGERQSLSELFLVGVVQLR